MSAEPDPDGSWDVAVVGSGFGGAVAACRLAQAGRSVVVLERGRRWAPHEFPRSIGQVADAFWQEGRSHGFLEYRAFRRLDVIQGAGVGGGSLHYFNVNLRAPAEIFDDPAWPSAVTRRTLEPYYELAEDALESRPLRPPPGRQELPARARVFVDAARRAGYDAAQAPLAVFTDPDRQHPVSGVHQRACVYCGNCLFGCDIGAKNTLDLGYLALAERRHGAEVRPLHRVEAIRPHARGGYEVTFSRLAAEPGGSPTSGRLHAARVVVAAGALGSTELLLSCRDRHGTLPHLGRATGRRFSLNGEMLLGYARDVAARVDPGLGPPIVAMASTRTRRGTVTVEDLGLPDALFWFLEGAMPPPAGRLRRLAVLAAAYLQRTLGLGDGTSRLSLELDALVAGGRTPHMLPYLGMGTDDADGELTLRDGVLDVRWSHRRNRAMYRAMEEMMARISAEAGGSFVPSFLWRWPLRKVLTAHPLGGCPMGDDPVTSAVDHTGAVWSYPGLHVVDGAIIPTALAVNPSLTIAALAERAAFWMIHGREMADVDPAAPPNR